MPGVARTRRWLLPEALVIALLIVGSGVGSLLLGQDANTDLHRYRFYIGYAFVHGRLDTDLVPAALGTFLNPTLDAFHYLGMAHLPPRLFGFLLGALQGLNPALVFLLARRLLDRGPGSGTLAVLVGVLAATGPTAHSLLGTTMGDTTASIRSSSPSSWSWETGRPRTSGKAHGPGWAPGSSRALPWV